MKSIEEQDLDNYDVQMAEKLIKSLENLKDLRLFKVPKPNSISMEKISLQDWVKWYCAKYVWGGSDGSHQSVLSIIDALDNQQQIMVERVENGFAKLLSVLDKKDIRISLLEAQIEKKETIINELKKFRDQLEQGTENDNIIYNPKTQETPQPTQSVTSKTGSRKVSAITLHAMKEVGMEIPK